MVSQEHDKAAQWLAEQSAAGLSNREIGELLGVTHTTVTRGRPSETRMDMSVGLRRVVEAHLAVLEQDDPTPSDVSVQDAGQDAGQVSGGVESAEDGDDEQDNDEGDGKEGNLHTDTDEDARDAQAASLSASESQAELTVRQTRAVPSPPIGSVDTDVSGEPPGGNGDALEASGGTGEAGTRSRTPRRRVAAVEGQERRAADEKRGWQERAHRGVCGALTAVQFAVVWDGLLASALREGSSVPVALRPIDEIGVRELDSLKAEALSLLSETPVLRHLSFKAAADVSSRAIQGTLSLLDPSPLIHGDARELVLTRRDVEYIDRGAQEVSLAPAPTLYTGGWSAAHLRAGVQLRERTERYARVEHAGRPRRIGYRRSRVIPDYEYPDELWFFGSKGFIDLLGQWHPGAGELVERWRHIADMYKVWDALHLDNIWALEMYRERAGLEITLMSPPYAMTFDQRILGHAEWPTSTRLGDQTQRRRIQLAANDLKIEAHRRRKRKARIKRAILHMPFRSIGWLVAALRSDTAIYEKAADGSGPDRLVRERLCPGLYESLERQRVLTRWLSWFLYRRHSELDGGVCGLSEWRILMPMTADYMTPNPRTGFIPSEAYRRRYRSHEFEPDYVPPVESAAEEAKSRGVGLTGRLLWAPFRAAGRSAVWTASMIGRIARRRRKPRQREAVLVRPSDEQIVMLPGKDD